MASNNQYEHYTFSQELINIDESVKKLDEQFDKAVTEIQKLGEMGKALKNHQSMFKDVWKTHNAEKFHSILIKAKELDNFISDNF